MLVLAGVAAVAQPGLSRLVPETGSDPLAFGDSLIRSGIDWLLGTAPVLAAGALAILFGQRSVVRPAWGLASCLIAVSTLIEIVGMATWWRFVDVEGLDVPATLYAASSIALAAAWLVVRGWKPLALFTSVLTGFASWFTIPALLAEGLFAPIRDALGTGAVAMFVTFIAVYTLQALVIGVAVMAALAWRRVRPTAQLRTDVA
jgi:hypothetical protein